MSEAFSRDGHCRASIAEDGTLRLWEAAPLDRGGEPMPEAARTCQTAAPTSVRKK